MRALLLASLALIVLPPVLVAASATAPSTGLPADTPGTRAHRATDIPGGSVLRREDPEALGGVALFTARPYEPIVRAKLPPAGESFFVWVRYRDAALQMKAEFDDRQVEFPWNWERHEGGFAWRRIGPHSRFDLGNAIIFIAAPDAPESAGIDAVVITTDDSFRPGR